MAQPAFFYETLDARLVTGRVAAGENGAFQVLAGHVRHDAFLAASCLLEPEIDDTVLLACLENGECAILSVLVRNATQAAVMRLPDNSVIACRGDLALRGETSLELQSGKTLRLEAQEMDVSAAEATASVSRVKTLFHTAEFCVNSLTTLGQTAVSAFHSLTQCLGQSRRMVQGSDETHCANSVLVAEETATVMSRNSLALAEETARTDAKLIQLG